MESPGEGRLGAWVKAVRDYGQKRCGVGQKRHGLGQGCGWKEFEWDWNMMSAEDSTIVQLPFKGFCNFRSFYLFSSVWCRDQLGV